MLSMLGDDVVIVDENIISGNVCNIENNTFYKEDITTSCSKIYISSEIVANKNINFYTNKVISDGTVYIYSQNGDININASKVECQGLIYAPNGKVVINADEINFKGIIIAEEIIINAGIVTINGSKEIYEYIEFLIMYANESYVKLGGVLLEGVYSLDIQCDKKLEYIDIYVRYGNNKSFEKYTTVYENNAKIENIEFETTIDFIAIGYTIYGESMSSTIESYGIDEYGDYYYFVNDIDNDNIADGIEVWYLKTDINSKDTDGDGFGDYYEVFVLGTDPVAFTVDNDRDGDGLTDKKEMEIGTNPYISDSDFDGVPDGEDVNPINYDIGKSVDKYEYLVVKTLFDITKICSDKDGNLYVYVYNYIQRKDKAVLGIEKNVIIYYDEMGRMVSRIKDYNGVYDVNTYEYSEDKLVGISNNGYKYRIDYIGDSVKTIYLNDNEIFDFEYNSEDVMVKEKFANGVDFIYNYDENGKIISYEVGGQGTFNYSYDEQGNIYSIINNSLGTNIYYEYDDIGIKEIIVDGEFAISYDDDSKKISTKYCIGDDVREFICIDEEGEKKCSLISKDKFASVVSQNIEKVFITFDDGENYEKTIEYNEKYIKSITYSNGMTESYEYNGGRIEKVLLNGKVTKEYQYDDFGQLIKEIDYSKNQSTVYAYKNDNIISKIYYVNDILTEEIYYTYDSVFTDKVLSVNGNEIEYDDEGNIRKFDGSSFEWEGNLLVGFENQENKALYSYNENGLRTSKNINGLVTSYYYDGEMLVAEKKEDNVIWYIYDMNAEIIGFIYNDMTYYYEKNATGDIISIINRENNNIEVIYEYNAWGEIVNIYGNCELAKINPFRYKSYYFDEESGMYYLKTRYYDSELVRFISPDGINAILDSYDNYNLYAYCSNDPVNYEDSTGLEKASVLVLCDKKDYKESPASTDKFYEAAKEYAQLTKSVAMLKTVSKDEFIVYWNTVLTKTKRNIVAITGHGSPVSISFDDEWLSIDDVNQLKKGKMDLLVLLQCNTAHDDYRLYKNSNNIAYAFYNKITDGTSNNKSMVLASDGTVVASSLGEFISVYDEYWKYYIIQSNRTKNYGWVLYRHGYSNYFVNYHYKIQDWEDSKGSGEIYYNCDYINFDSMVKRLTSVYSLKFIQVK